jgi:DNA-binding response OmpR family regulator
VPNSEPTPSTNPDRKGPSDRRRVPRGGRRDYDRTGRYPVVLVAESYEGARRPFVRYLERYHFDVAEATNGEEMLARIVASPPRVVLMEWGLPLISGSPLTQWLAQGWRTRQVRVIALAGDVDPGAEMPRADGVLVKPFSLSAMLEEVRRVLR